MKSAIAGILFSMTAIVGAGHASASPLTFTYKGFVTSGTDAGGYFGATGADLTGQTFEYVQTFDTSKASNYAPSEYYTTSTGGAAYASAKIQIGSSAFLVIKGDTTANYANNGSHSSWSTYDHEGQSGTIQSGEHVSTNFVAYSPLLTAADDPADITWLEALYDGGRFSVSDHSYDSATYLSGSRSASATFALQSLTISSVSAVPLPAAAPMFGAALLGLAAIGAGTRRRRSAAAA